MTTDSLTLYAHSLTICGKFFYNYPYVGEEQSEYPLCKILAPEQGLMLALIRCYEVPFFASTWSPTNFRTDTSKMAKIPKFVHMYLYHRVVYANGAICTFSDQDDASIVVMDKSCVVATASSDSNNIRSPEFHAGNIARHTREGARGGG